MTLKITRRTFISWAAILTASSTVTELDSTELPVDDDQPKTDLEFLIDGIDHSRFLKSGSMTVTRYESGLISSQVGLELTDQVPSIWHSFLWAEKVLITLRHQSSRIEFTAYVRSAGIEPPNVMLDVVDVAHCPDLLAL